MQKHEAYKSSLQLSEQNVKIINHKTNPRERVFSRSTNYYYWNFNIV